MPLKIDMFKINNFLIRCTEKIADNRKEVVKEVIIREEDSKRKEEELNVVETKEEEEDNSKFKREVDLSLELP